MTMAVFHKGIGHVIFSYKPPAFIPLHARRTSVDDEKNVINLLDVQKIDSKYEQSSYVILHLATDMSK